MKKRYFRYKIIQTLPIGDVTFYIGYKKNDRYKYATFFKRDNNTDFAWIRFFNDLYSAQKDIVDRAYREIPNLDFNLEMKEETIYGDKAKIIEGQGYGKTASFRIRK